jgi:hypothetical protein
MRSEHMKNSFTRTSRRQVLSAVPSVLVSGLFAAGLLLFGGQGAAAQETSTIATDTSIVSGSTVVANDGIATDTTLLAEVISTTDSTLAATVDDSTPDGGLETGFGGTASGSDSDRSGLYFATAGVGVLGALAVRKVAKRPASRTDRRS